MAYDSSKLRFRELSRAATATAVIGAVALQPVVAAAATGSVQIHQSNTTWFVNTNITFATTSSGFGMSEATLVTPSTNRNDAFDGAGSWLIGTGAANTSTGTIDPTTIYQSPGGTVSVTATEVDGAAQTLAGLTVTGQLTFSPTKAVVRDIIALQNPTGAPITVNVAQANNLGSDNNTFIQDTQDGDQTFTDGTDHWWISSQGPDASPTSPTCCDPVETWALAEAGAPVQPTTDGSVVNGNDNPNMFYTVTIPAGQTRRLMEFIQLSGSVAGAETDATAFNSGTNLLANTDYLAGMTAQERSEVVNWNLPFAIPTLSPWAMAALLGLFGTAGFVIVGADPSRRRRWLEAMSLDHSRQRTGGK